MSESMVENIANALKRRFEKAVTDAGGKIGGSDGMSMPSDDLWRDYARAAIGAMRTPTEAMRLAARGVQTPSADNIWRAMIAAILSEE